MRPLVLTGGDKILNSLDSSSCTVGKTKEGGEGNGEDGRSKAEINANQQVEMCVDGAEIRMAGRASN